MTKNGAHPKTRRMMEIAIRRLNVLEYVILGVAMALALLAGALAAWMIQDVTGAPFRLTWALSSLVFFVAPGWVALRRERRARTVREGAIGDAARTAATPPAAHASPAEEVNEKTDDGGR